MDFWDLPPENFYALKKQTVSTYCPYESRVGNFYFPCERSAGENHEFAEPEARRTILYCTSLLRPLRDRRYTNSHVFEEKCGPGGKLLWRDWDAEQKARRVPCGFLSKKQRKQPLSVGVGATGEKRP